MVCRPAHVVCARSPEHYEIVCKLGRGKYSDVFKGVDTDTGKTVVIKVLKPVKKKKIRREVMVLNTLKGGVNILNVWSCTLPASLRLLSSLSLSLSCRCHHYHHYHITIALTIIALIPTRRSPATRAASSARRSTPMRSW